MAVLPAPGLACGCCGGGGRSWAGLCCHVKAAAQYSSSWQSPWATGQVLGITNCVLGHHKSPPVLCFPAGCCLRGSESDSPSETFSTFLKNVLPSLSWVISTQGAETSGPFQLSFPQKDTLWSLDEAKARSLSSPSQCWKPEHLLVCQDLAFTVSTLVSNKNPL